MHTLHLTLSVSLLSISTLYGASHGFAAAEGVPSAQLLPDGFFGLDKYEVLSMHQDGEEDVVHIRKRAGDDDCGSDCMAYSGFSEDNLQHCDADIEELLDKRSLEKRGRKPIKADVCKGVLVNGAAQPGFYLISPTWPTPETLETRHKKQKTKRIYDTGDPTKPYDIKWFELQVLDERWAKDIAGRKDPARCYDAEHVLEWQLLKTFIEEDMASPNSRCVLMHKYFMQELDKKSYKVKVAKNDGALKNDKFELEDGTLDFSNWNVVVKKGGSAVKPRLIDFVSHQWPGTAGGSPPNPFEYEMILLGSDANGKKENVWGDKKVFPEPKLDGKKMKYVKDNTLTLEALFDNHYYENDKQKTWDDNMGKCKAVHMFMTLMTLVQYHNDAYIRAVMRAQVQRVGAAFEYLETEVLPKAQVKGYTKRGLKKEWEDWMTKYHKARLDALQAALEDKMKVFEKSTGITTKMKRWDYLNIFKRVDTKKPNCGFEKDNKKMDERVQLLKDAFKKMKKVNSELKLD
ncbi:hypothetical protein CC86DRAFT_353149 [Ophiobolus disseminans]|uniref:Uncharacterized protein n=1 Tax=Ophiobolus disseminans TaxID=1469910 RepID=A0A6A6ZW07_9PLEO|nr:hypothetical protein CC86DRAFT_353149 [Ophiobolus disseminans]